jgi:hypothetical protein
MRNVPIQQTTIVVLHVNVLVTTKLPIYGNGVPIQQTIRANSYPQLGGESPGASLNGRSPKEGSLD